MLMNEIAIARIKTRAWSAPSLGVLPAVCVGTHVFHAWLGSGEVTHVVELSSWMSLLTDRLSRIHVWRTLPLTAVQCNSNRVTKSLLAFLGAR